METQVQIITGFNATIVYPKMKFLFLCTSPNGEIEINFIFGVNSPLKTVAALNGPRVFFIHVFFVTFFGFGEASSHGGPGVKPGGPMKGKPRLGDRRVGRFRRSGWATGPEEGECSTGGGKFGPVGPTQPSQESATVHNTQPEKKKKLCLCLSETKRFFS